MPIITHLTAPASDLQFGDLVALDSEHPSARVAQIVKRTSRSIEFRYEQPLSDCTTVGVIAVPLTRKLQIVRSYPTDAERAEQMRAVLVAKFEMLVAEARESRDRLRADMIERITASNDMSDVLAWQTEGWMRSAEASKLAVRLAATLSLADTVPAQIAAVRRHVSMCHDELIRWTPAESTSAARNLQSKAVHHALREVVQGHPFAYLLGVADEYEQLVERVNAEKADEYEQLVELADAVIAENIAHERQG